MNHMVYRILSVCDTRHSNTPNNMLNVSDNHCECCFIL